MVLGVLAEPGCWVLLLAEVLLLLPLLGCLPLLPQEANMVRAMQALRATARIRFIFITLTSINVLWIGSL